MGLHRTEGIVLRSRKLGEYDRLVTLLTRSEGKVAAVARGAGRPRSPLLAPCQPFTFGHFHLFRRRGTGLQSLREGEVAEAFAPLREDWERMAFASYAAELVDRAVPELDPQPHVFALLLGALHLFAWEKSSRELWAALRKYELRLLSLLGYRPQLDGCATCGAALDGAGAAFYPFDADAGGLVCRRCASGTEERLGAETVAVMRQILQVGLARMRVIKPSARALEELGNVTEVWVDRHLEGEIRSRALLRSLATAGGERLPAAFGERGALRGRERPRSTGPIAGGDEA